MSVASVLVALGGSAVAASAASIDAVPGDGSGSGSLAARVPSALGAAALLSGLLSATGSAGPPLKGQPGYVRYMAAVHVGLLLPGALGVVYAARALRARGRGGHAAAVNNALLAGLSAVALLCLVALKPKKKAA